MTPTPDRRWLMQPDDQRGRTTVVVCGVLGPLMLAAYFAARDGCQRWRIRCHARAGPGQAVAQPPQRARWQRPVGIGSRSPGT